MRTAVRAELRERGVQALGMDCAEAVGRAMASGQTPAALVLEGTSDFLSNAGIQNLMSRVPTILIASRTEKIPLPQSEPPATDCTGSSHPYLGVILYRPVQVGEVVTRVLELLNKPHPA